MKKIRYQVTETCTYDVTAEVDDDFNTDDINAVEEHWVDIDLVDREKFFDAVTDREVDVL